MPQGRNIRSRNRFFTPSSYTSYLSLYAVFPKTLSHVFAVGLLVWLTGISFAQTGDVVISTNTTWAAGQYTLNSLRVTNGATLTLEGANRSGQVDGQWQGYGVTITAASVQVDAGSAISANAQGYTGGATGVSGNGPGGGCGSAAGAWLRGRGS